MRDPGPAAQGRQQAEAVRFANGLGTAPIRDLFELVESMDEDLLVARRPMVCGSPGILLRFQDRWLLVVNSGGRTLREQRFAAAHLLGHALLDGRGSERSLHVDGALLDDGAAAEVRASSFASHLLLPAVTLIEQLSRCRAVGAWTVECLMVLSLEFGIDMPSLLWHLRHADWFTEADRREVVSAEVSSCSDVLRVGSRRGMWELVRWGRSACDTIAWPRRYMAAVAQAFDRGLVGENDLLELVEDPDQVRDIIELTDEARVVGGEWRSPGPIATMRSLHVRPTGPARRDGGPPPAVDGRGPDLRRPGLRVMHAADDGGAGGRETGGGDRGDAAEHG